MKKLSGKMTKCLDKLTEHGKLVRYQGGFWSMANAAFEPGKEWPIWSFGTTTIEALIRRDLVEVTGTKSGQYGFFPVEVSLTKNKQNA